MASKSLIRNLLILSVAVTLVASCGGKAGPTLTPTPVPEPSEAPQIDMYPYLTQMLNSLPDAWGLMPAQAVAALKPTLIDVREPDEYATGFIEGAINIPLRQLTRSLDALPLQDAEVVLVCDTGHRGAMGMVTLQLLGWKRAKSVYNGLRGWTEANLPLVQQPVPKRPSGGKPKVDETLLAVLDDYLNRRLSFDLGKISVPALLAAQQETPFEEYVDPESYTPGPPYLIDVSEPAEFAKGSLEGAVNMPIHTMLDHLEEIPWENPMIVTCGIESVLPLDRTWKRIVTLCINGHRAAVAMMALQLMGYRDVHALEGGLKVWDTASQQ